MVTRSIAFRPDRRAWGRKAAHLMASRKQREQEKKWNGQHISFKGMPPVTYFHQLGPSPNFHHLSRMTSNYEPIKGLIF
jgi:hypothetical protein